MGLRDGDEVGEHGFLDVLLVGRGADYQGVLAGHEVRGNLGDDVAGGDGGVLDGTVFGAVLEPDAGQGLGLVELEVASVDVDEVSR